MIYLDNNATTQLDPAVIEEMMPFLTECYANPSSGYKIAAQARKAIDLARQRLAQLLGCEPNEIVFTSGGTESNNAAINSALQHEPRGKHIVVSAVEHSAVRRYAEELARRGCEVTSIGVDESGDVDLAAIERAIRPNTAIVSMMWANNETGVLFPVEKIAQICREKRVPFHTDAVQTIGKIPMILRESAINLLSLSAHKFHGPKGVGALYIKMGTAFQPSVFGGSHENGRRAGTENVQSIVGLGKAAECANAALEDEQQRVRKLRDRFEHSILARVAGAAVNGAGGERLHNTSNISFSDIESQAALMLLDRHEVCCSAGSACKTGSNEGSHVLKAMHLGDSRTRGSIRFSLGRFNSERDVDLALDIVPKAVAKLRSLAPAAKLAGSDAG